MYRSSSTNQLPLSSVEGLIAATICIDNTSLNFNPLAQDAEITTQMIQSEPATSIDMAGGWEKQPPTATSVPGSCEGLPGPNPFGVLRACYPLEYSYREAIVGLYSLYWLYMLTLLHRVKQTVRSHQSVKHQQHHVGMMLGPSSKLSIFSGGGCLTGWMGLASVALKWNWEHILACLKHLQRCCCEDGKALHGQVTTTTSSSTVKQLAPRTPGT